MIFDLPENPELYFELSENAQLIELSNLEPVRARPEGIARATLFMIKAANGLTTKRAPLKVRRIQERRFQIIDGNSTFAVAKAFGWQFIPVEIVETAVDQHSPIDLSSGG